MSTENSTLIIVQTFLGAMGGRDLETILSLFNEEVDWYIPGDETLAPWLGRRSNKLGIIDFYTKLWAATEPVSATVDHIFVDGDKAIVTGEFATKMLATGRVVDSMFHIQFTVTGGKIVRYRLLEDSLAVYRSLAV